MFGPRDDMGEALKLAALVIVAACLGVGIGLGALFVWVLL